MDMGKEGRASSGVLHSTVLYLLLFSNDVANIQIESFPGFSAALPGTRGSIECGSGLTYAGRFSAVDLLGAVVSDDATAQSSYLNSEGLVCRTVRTALHCCTVLYSMSDRISDKTSDNNPLAVVDGPC